MPWWAWFLCLATVAAVLYWLLVIAEGAYLGPRFVVALYDRYATRYDQVKQFDEADEAFFLGDTLARDLVAPLLRQGQTPLVLDVATGTGRYPLAVLRATQGQCQLWGLDGSLAMLGQAQRSLVSAGWSNVTLIHHRASRLPLQKDRFDAVACLEALEFLPDPVQTLQELWRVLRPGGVLTISNRIGPQARLLPGRTFSRPQLEIHLAKLGAVDVVIRPWQVDYDLVTARKPACDPPPTEASLGEVLACPVCDGAAWTSREDAHRLDCQTCGAAWVRSEDIWCLQWPDAVERKNHRGPGTSSDGR